MANGDVIPRRRSTDNHIGFTLKEIADDHEVRLRVLEEAHVVSVTQQRLILTLLKAVFGISIIGAATGVVTLLDMIQHIAR